MIDFLANVREREETLAGNGPASQRLREQVERIARTPRTTVLLLGSGLRDFEGVARAIHARSQGKGPYGSVHAGSLRAEPGSTRAGELREHLRRCRGGSLFLQEVLDLDTGVQEQLLDYLNENTNENASGRRPSSPRAPETPDSAPRVLVSTTQDLERGVEAGGFRPDLFYRLNVLTLRLPSLRDRLPDLGELARAMLRRLQTRFGTECRLSPKAEEILAVHPWPGDLFELEAVLTQGAIGARGTPIGPEHLNLGPAGASSDSLIPYPTASRSLRESEEALIRRVLAEETGNRSSAARVLGINRTTLYNKLRQYGIA